MNRKLIPIAICLTVAFTCSTTNAEDAKTAAPGVAKPAASENYEGKDKKPMSGESCPKPGPCGECDCPPPTPPGNGNNGDGGNGNNNRGSDGNSNANENAR